MFVTRVAFTLAGFSPRSSLWVVRIAKAGQFKGDWDNQGGPVHQVECSDSWRGVNPLVAKSAGFSYPGMNFQAA